MQISNILSQVDLGAMALPEFQRGYVWNRDQVRELITSLYRRYPVGSLLVWSTRTDQASARGDANLQPGYVELILDGQQRITSLYGVIRGRPPEFFQGNTQAFSGLYFNLASETFKFYSPLEMKDDPLWVSVTDLMQQNVGPFTNRLLTAGVDPQKLGDYITRLNNVHAIQSVDLHAEKVAGEDKTIDVVVDIFNKVNSGGTKLSKGDLALAKICASWPEARERMRDRLKRWAEAGFYFDLDWLLRNVTTIATGQALFSGLSGISVADFQNGLQQAERSCNDLLNMLSARLGLDHDRVLGSRYAFPVMSRFLVQRGGKLGDIAEQNRLLYWYIHSFLWGRFAGSTESALNQDLRAIADGGDPLDQLIAQLRLWRGDLRVRPEDFGGNSMGARFYPMLYLLTRVLKARDWGHGALELNAHMLGKLNWLQVHHIFPKALLYRSGYVRGEVNAIANFCFLTQQTNLEISDRQPDAYFEEVERRYPGALASQWIPMDRELWKVARYRDFLAARRELLAQAANNLLDSLLAGAARSEPVADQALDRAAPPMPLPGGADEEELQAISAFNAWVAELGLPQGEVLYELADTQTGAPLAIIDLAWPRGLQEGLSQPVALLLNEAEEVEEIVNQAGYRFFTNVDDLRAYVEQQVLSMPAVDTY
jgi:hypothetical protein